MRNGTSLRFISTVAAGCALGALFLATTGASTAHADTLSGLADSGLEIDDEYVFGIDQPTAIAFLPDGRMLIAERTGDLLLREADGTLGVAGSLPVNATPAEQGLLNVVVDPEFTATQRLFLYYSASDAVGGTAADRHRVVSVELGEDGKLDMSTERIVLRGLMGPDNHNGGGLSIYGEYLFVGSGDTGHNSFSTPGADIGNYFGSCLTNLQGKVLRVHLDGSIPSDNPLIGKTVTECPSDPGTAPTGTSNSPREEIFAWGFRNPFRLWADPKTGNVWVGNVGESTFEMVQLVPPSGGLHFGWPYREGNHGLGPEECQNTAPNVGNCTDAIYICEQSDNGGGYSTPAPDDPRVLNDCDSISGGVILDDCQWPDSMEGHYVFGDFQNERVWTLPVNSERNGVTGERSDLMRAQDGGPVSFAEFGGALYVVVHSGNGHITRIAPKNPEPACGSAGSNGPGVIPSPADGGTTPSASSDAGDGCAYSARGERANDSRLALGWLVLGLAFARRQRRH